ncbi:MAG: tetratricopeptide repeat protein [Anaerolineae bacterium]|nr:tetratricopeptide repeat protein [Anaerolineae bacterium]MDX9828852.1 CheR family methyltransferase [Anaerolineae bacterium]
MNPATEPLPDERLQRFARAVEERFGLSFPPRRQADLERGLRQAFAASTCQDLDEYYCLIQDPQAGALEMDRLVNALTVGETYFFRDAGQFNALYDHILPDIIERRRSVRVLRLWSAGCASGEEPYSLAMMVRDLLPDADDWVVTILGSDVNAEALQRARTAEYGEWAFREERAREARSRFFEQREKRWILRPEVQRMVTFQRLNLAGTDFPSFATNTALMDLVLCRNVTIYFSQAATRRVVNRLYEALVDGGWLVVGHAEPSPGTYHRFQVHTFPDAVIFRRPYNGVVAPAAWEAAARQRPGQPRKEFLQPTRTSQAALSQAVTPAPETPPPGQAPAAPLRPESEGDPVQQARELLEFGHVEEARSLLLRAASNRPGSAECCVLLGQVYANLGHWQEAERWCEEAIDLDCLTIDAYYTLALVLQHQGRLDEALVAMRKVVYIDRHSILGYFGLADLYHSRGELPQALKALENARRLLDLHPPDEVLPGSGGITAARLRETVVRQQRQWRAQASPGSIRKHEGKERYP